MIAMRCVDGPYAGQTIAAHQRPRCLGYVHGVAVYELVWIACGPDRYAYSPMENGMYSRHIRLVYRDTF